MRISNNLYFLKNFIEQHDSVALQKASDWREPQAQALSTTNGRAISEAFALATETH